MFYENFSIFQGLATILAVSGLVSSSPIPKTNQAEKDVELNLLDSNRMTDEGLPSFFDALDEFSEHSNSRMKRYSMQGSRWPTNNLTYRISGYPGSLSQSDVESEIGLAFSIWSQHANLTFKQKRTEPVHITIKFVHGYHGDEQPLPDGNVISHAFPPNHGGDIHFDSFQEWTANSQHGFSLSWAAAYEIGRALGLTSSSEPSSVMYPVYNGFKGPLQISADDIEGIQFLYGKKNTDPVHIARMES